MDEINLDDDFDEDDELDFTGGSPAVGGPDAGSESGAGNAAENLKLEDRIEELHKINHTDHLRYVSDRVQNELRGLYVKRYGTGPDTRRLLGDDVPDGYERGLSRSTEGGEERAPTTSGLTSAEAEDTSAGPETAPELSDEESETIRGLLREAYPETAAVLEREWVGVDFNQNIAIGRAVTSELADEPLLEILETTGLGDHPVVLNFAAKIGRFRGTESDPAVIAAFVERAARDEIAGESVVSVLEDFDLMADPAIKGLAEKLNGLLVGDTFELTETTDQGTIQARIDQIHALQYTNEKKLRTEKIQKELSGLYVKLYGHGDAVGPARATLI
ncbi:MAG: hypothetical protein IIA72_08650 [Proteobacteria bacterium]|nr:hypothetical protein [Pseudomonadota bacterium]